MGSYTVLGRWFHVVAIYETENEANKVTLANKKMKFERN